MNIYVNTYLNQREHIQHDLKHPERKNRFYNTQTKSFTAYFCNNKKKRCLFVLDVCTSHLLMAGVTEMNDECRRV